jgi:hypothetical protein
MRKQMCAPNLHRVPPLQTVWLIQQVPNAIETSIKHLLGLKFASLACGARTLKPRRRVESVSLQRGAFRAEATTWSLHHRTQTRATLSPMLESLSTESLHLRCQFELSRLVSGKPWD